MDKPNLIIFKFRDLYQILKEVEEFLNFKVIEATNEKSLEELKTTLNDFFIVSQKENDSLDLQLVLDKLPIKISKLTEKINIQLLKFQFNQKSDLYIGKYKLDLNSRGLVTYRYYIKAF